MKSSQSRGGASRPPVAESPGKGAISVPTTTLSRRGFLTSTVAAALGAPALARARSTDPIVFASILDLTGALSIYGASMAYLTRMAIDDINARGGLLGRSVTLKLFDAESNDQLYATYATQAATDLRASVVQGAIASTSREVIRPILSQLGTIYFYNTQYEGGVCDANCFCTGATASQTASRLVPHAMNTWGNRVYVVAADFIYGQITTEWIRRFVAEQGGETVGVDLVSLDTTNFAPTIDKIMRAAPNLVISALVGGAHVSFYRQFAAAGLHNEIPMASTTFGVGNEQELVLADASDGMLAAYSYFESIDNPANVALLARLTEAFGPDRPALNELAVRSYEGAMLWAAAVEAAGSVERDAVTEVLRAGMSYDGPSGRMTIDPGTNNAILNVYIAELRNRKWSVAEHFSAQPPFGTRLVCDLMTRPGESRNYFANGLASAGIE